MNNTLSIHDPQKDQYDYSSLDMSDYVSLEGSTGYALLAEEHELVLAPQTGQVTLVNWQRRRFVTDCLFPAQEYAVLLLLLDFWPSYAPTELLLQAVQQHAAPTHEPQEPAGHEASLAHLHAVLLSCQQRLHPFGLDLIAVGELGMLLIQSQESAIREEHADAHETHQDDPSTRPATPEARD